jgi:hypothetical protein
MSTATDQASKVADTTKSQTQQVASHAADAAGSVVDTAKQQAGDVAVEASTQASELLNQAQQHVAAEGERQASKLAGNLRRLAGELTTMANAGSTDTPLPSLLQQLAAKGESMAELLETNGPDGLMRELQTFGRRRPGALLATAAAAGFAATRLMKHSSDDEATSAAPAYPDEPSTTRRRTTGTARTTSTRTAR